VKRSQLVTQLTNNSFISLFNPSSTSRSITYVFHHWYSVAMAQYDTKIRWSENDFNDELACIWKEAVIVCYVSTKVSTHVQTSRLT
jgi:hypothetical protein